MFEAFAGRIRARAATAVLAAAAMLATAGCASGTAAGDSVPRASSSWVTVAGGPGLPVVLRLGDHTVAAMLADTPAAREFAAMLPVTLVLHDAWGQATVGRLPHPLDTDGAARVFKPTPGGIYYWSDTADLAVYYDDLGQSVPPPGLIYLGTVDNGLSDITGASGRVVIQNGT